MRHFHQEQLPSTSLPPSSSSSAGLTSDCIISQLVKLAPPDSLLCLPSSLLLCPLRLPHVLGRGCNLYVISGAHVTRGTFCVSPSLSLSLSWMLLFSSLSLAADENSLSNCIKQPIVQIGWRHDDDGDNDHGSMYSGSRVYWLLEQTADDGSVVSF